MTSIQQFFSKTILPKLGQVSAHPAASQGPSSAPLSPHAASSAMLSTFPSLGPVTHQSHNPIQTFEPNSLNEQIIRRYYIQLPFSLNINDEVLILKIRLPWVHLTCLKLWLINKSIKLEQRHVFATIWSRRRETTCQRTEYTHRFYKMESTIHQARDR